MDIKCKSLNGFCLSERSEFLVAEIAKDEIKLKTFCSPQMRYSEPGSERFNHRMHKRLVNLHF